MKNLVCSFTVAVALLACDSHSEEHHETESPIDVGCHHFEFGPHCSSPPADSDDPPCGDVVTAHQHFKIDLDPARRIPFEATRHADHYVLVGAGVEVTLTDEMGAEVAVVATVVSPDELCDQAALAKQYLLEVGQYTLNLTGTGVVDLVVHRVDAADSHDDDA